MDCQKCHICSSFGAVFVVSCLDMSVQDENAKKYKSVKATDLGSFQNATLLTVQAVCTKNRSIQIGA